MLKLGGSPPPSPPPSTFLSLEPDLVKKIIGVHLDAKSAARMASVNKDSQKAVTAMWDLPRQRRLPQTKDESKKEAMSSIRRAVLKNKILQYDADEQKGEKHGSAIAHLKAQEQAVRRATTKEDIDRIARSIPSPPRVSVDAMQAYRHDRASTSSTITPKRKVLNEVIRSAYKHNMLLDDVRERMKRSHRDAMRHEESQYVSALAQLGDIKQRVNRARNDEEIGRIASDIPPPPKVSPSVVRAHQQRLAERTASARRAVF